MVNQQNRSSDTEAMNTNSDSSPIGNLHSSMMRGAEYPFPVKLHYLIQDAEDRGLDNIISWLPDGKGFIIHNPKEAAKSILPIWFRHRCYGSFQRQLNIYNFQRIKSPGSSKASYHHDLFVKGVPPLSYGIKRFPVKAAKGRNSHHVHQHDKNDGDATPAHRKKESFMRREGQFSPLYLSFHHNQTEYSPVLTQLSPSWPCSPKSFCWDSSCSSDDDISSVFFLHEENYGPQKHKNREANHQILLEHKGGEHASMMMERLFDQREDIQAEIIRTFLPTHL